MNKPTLVLGASANPERYAWKAAVMLLDYGHTIIPVGIKKGEIAEHPIQREFPAEAPHTITLYLNALNQQPWYDAILNSGVQRIIFNPGTENGELQEAAEVRGIETLEACTLVLLRTGQY